MCWLITDIDPPSPGNTVNLDLFVRGHTYRSQCCNAAITQLTWSKRSMRLGSRRQNSLYDNTLNIHHVDGVVLHAQLELRYSGVQELDLKL